MKTGIYITGIIIGLSVLSCTGNSEIDVTPELVDDTPKVTWASSVDTQPVLGSEGGTLVCEFTATADWTASVINDRADGWLQVSPKSGSKGKGSITLQVAPNEEYDERRATIQVESGSAKATLTVTQKQKDAITASASKLEFGVEGGTFTIEITTNIDYSCSVEEGANWIVPADTKGMEKHSQTFRVMVNEEVEARRGTVVVTSALGEETFRIYQLGEEPVLVLSEKEVSVEAEGGEFTVELRSNVPVNVEMPTDADWISEVTTKTMSTDSRTFQVSANETYDSREAVLRFYNDQMNLSETVKVVQKQKDVIIASASKLEFGAEGGSFAIEITSNIEYTCKVDEAANWIVPVETKGLVQDMLTFLVEVNDDVEVRRGTVVLTSILGEETFRIFQQGTEPVLVLSEKEVGVEAEGGVFTVELRSNVPINLEMPKDADWISEVTTKAMYTDTRTFQVSANETYDSREAVVRFYNEEMGLSETVKVVQKPTEAFFVSPEIIKVPSAASLVEVKLSSNVEPQIEIDVPWICQVQTKALTETQLYFQVDENTADDIRQGHISFRWGDILQVVTVTQAMTVYDNQVPGFYGMAGLDWALLPQQMQLFVGRPSGEAFAVFALIEPGTNRFIRMRYRLDGALTVGASVHAEILQNVEPSKVSVMEDLVFKVKALDGPFITLEDGAGKTAVIKQ